MNCGSDVLDWHEQSSGQVFRIGLQTSTICIPGMAYATKPFGQVAIPFVEDPTLAVERSPLNIFSEQFFKLLDAAPQQQKPPKVPAKHCVPLGHPLRYPGEHACGENVMGDTTRVNAAGQTLDDAKNAQIMKP